MLLSDILSVGYFFVSFLVLLPFAPILYFTSPARKGGSLSPDNRFTYKNPTKYTPLFHFLNVFCAHPVVNRVFALPLLRYLAAIQHAKCKKASVLAPLDLFGPQGSIDEGNLLLWEDVYLCETVGTPPFTARLLDTTVAVPAQLVASRLKFMEQVASIPRSVFETPVKSPIFILGCNRTGSTLLQRLMARDPACRFMRSCDMLNAPTPYANRDEWHDEAKVAALVEAFEQSKHIRTGWAEAFFPWHYFHPAAAEEELLLLFQASVFAHYDFLSIAEGNRKSSALLEHVKSQRNKVPAYRYLQRYLQASAQYYQPESHWLLKCPFHSQYIDSLHEVFPNARFINLHRNLESVLPSSCHMALTSISENLTLANSVDVRKMRDYELDLVDRSLSTLSNFRKRNPNVPFMDVAFHDFIKDPIEMIKTIYEHFDMEASPEFCTNMETYLKENPKGRFGKVSYSAEEFGLTNEDIRTRYAAYYEENAQYLAK